MKAPAAAVPAAGAFAFSALAFARQGGMPFRLSEYVSQAGQPGGLSLPERRPAVFARRERFHKGLQDVDPRASFSRMLAARTFVVNAYANQTWVVKNGHTMFCEKCHRATGPNPKKALSPSPLAAAKKLLIL